MEPWSIDQPLAELESRAKQVKATFDRLVAQRATNRVLGDAMGDVAQALANLYRFQWSYNSELPTYEAYKAKRKNIQEVRDAAFALRDTYLIMAHSEEHDPWVTILLKAREIGWPRYYVEDLLEHDYRWLRTSDISEGFCFCLRELGTHIGNYGYMLPVWNVWGNDGIYFSYHKGTLRQITDKSHWGKPRYGGRS